MIITINGLPARIKEGTSFEYISENRLFSNSDSYTLSITFPLRGCPENLEIFGLILRPDVDITTVLMDCVITDKAVRLEGALAIVEVTESQVQGQFLEGRAVQNYDRSWTDCYINEIYLGSPDNVAASGVLPREAWSGSNYVALPWVHDSNGRLQNGVTYQSGQAESYTWAAGVKKLSYQPYVIYLAKRICQHYGYTYDFSAWEASPWRYLLCCNTLPQAWELPNFHRALPRWTPEEFFMHLEQLMGCSIDIDHRAEHVSMAFNRDFFRGEELFRPEAVVDEYVAEVDIDETTADYRGITPLTYKECDHQLWKYMRCDWFIDDISGRQSPDVLAPVRYTTLEAYITQHSVGAWRTYKVVGGGKEWDDGQPSLAPKVAYIEQDDMYVISTLRDESTWTDGGTEYGTCRQVAIPVNEFGMGGREYYNRSDDNAKELEIVPVRIDETDDRGLAMFLSFSGFSEATDPEEEGNELTADDPVAILKSGEPADNAEYYNRMYVAYWYGLYGSHIRAGKNPRPYITDCTLLESMAVVRTEGSLRLNNRPAALDEQLPAIDPTVKYTYTLLSRTIPSIRSIFIIAGKRYICAKLTATFSERGMGQQIKAECYRVR